MFNGIELDSWLFRADRYFHMHELIELGEDDCGCDKFRRSHARLVSCQGRKILVQVLEELEDAITRMISSFTERDNLWTIFIVQARDHGGVLESVL